MRDVELYKLAEGNLVLVGVDTEGFSTATIDLRIPQAIGVFESASTLGTEPIPATDRFVLNLSFGIVPCRGVVPDLAEYIDYLTDPDLQVLRDELERTGVGDVDHTLAWYLAPPIDEIYPPGHFPGQSDLSFLSGDPLYARFKAYADDSSRKVISVGAAGNFRGYGYPLAPALWPTVVSVSADYQEVDGGCFQGVPLVGPRNPDLFSNPGEVQMPGDHDTECSVAGTSFAAPRLSFQAARHLLQGGDVSCEGEGGETTPPLAYADPYAEQPGPWEDYGLDAAADTFCWDFPTDVP
jgi:hypothetical protein